MCLDRTVLRYRSRGLNGKRSRLFRPLSDSPCHHALPNEVDLILGSIVTEQNDLTWSLPAVRNPCAAPMPWKSQFAKLASKRGFALQQVFLTFWDF